MPSQDQQRGEERISGPSEGDFIAPPAVAGDGGRADTLPHYGETWRPPAGFRGAALETEPLGWDRSRGYYRLFPPVSLPFQVVGRVTFGHPGREPNRLFQGDNLYVMRQLPDESIDLIYIDPPFFSGRRYTATSGGVGERRSFSDIWEGGLSGYLVWLNARLYEMRRLLKKTGSVIVHCDHHASHYIKVELDKLFGAGQFRNEIIWSYESGGRSRNSYPRKHDVLLWFAKQSPYFSPGSVGIPRNVCPQCGRTLEKWNNLKKCVDEDGRTCRTIKSAGKVYRYYDDEPASPSDVWLGINHLQQRDPERIGYPTQKPEKLLERVIGGWCPEGGTVADFFCGAGTTVAVAQRMGRRWIACDRSPSAVAVTADRLAKQAMERVDISLPVPDFTRERWGVYETPELDDISPERFRAFVLRAFGAAPDENGEDIHGWKDATPVRAGAPDGKRGMTAAEVISFAEAIRGTAEPECGVPRKGVLLARTLSPDASKAAERLRRRGRADLEFVKLDLVRMDAPRVADHGAALPDGPADDGGRLLTFVLPPKVEVEYTRVAPRTFAFDAGGTAILNPDAGIASVQWDFSGGEEFTASPGCSFSRESEGEAILTVQYEFPAPGVKRIVCRVGDDRGGEGTWTGEIEVD